MQFPEAYGAMEHVALSTKLLSLSPKSFVGTVSIPLVIVGPAKPHTPVAVCSGFVTY